MSVDPNKLKTVKEVGRRETLFSVARQPQSSRLFVGASDGKIYDLDAMADKPEPAELAGHTSYVTGLALIGSRLVSASWDGRIIFWEADTHEQLQSIDAHQKWIRGLAASADGKLLASVGDDMVCRLWDGDSGKLRHELRGHEPITPHHFPSMLYAVAISADGSLVATGDRIGHVVLWDAQSGKQLATLEAPVMYTWDPRQRIHSIGGIRSLAFSPDSRLLAVGGMGEVGNIDHLGGASRIEIFDWQAGQRTHEISDEKYKGLVERLQFGPSGEWLCAAGGDNSGFIKFLDIASAKPKDIKLEKAPMHVHDFVFSESFEDLYTVGNGRIVAWELKG